MVQRPKLPKDDGTFTRLKAAYQANAIIVSVNGNRLNRPGSPVFDPWESLTPLLAILLLSVLFMFLIQTLVGIAFLMLGVIVYLLLIHPWILGRVRKRTLEAAMENVHNWSILWKAGGLRVACKHTDAVCRSPKGDWKAFVARYLETGSTDGELYKTMKGSERDSVEVPASPDADF